MADDHPRDDALRLTEVSDETAVHLRDCPHCRAHRRRLRLAEQGPAPRTVPTHPSEETLRRDELDAATAAHLEDCPRCRIERRRLLAAESTLPPVDAEPSGAGDEGHWTLLVALTRAAGCELLRVLPGDGDRPFGVVRRDGDEYLASAYPQREGALVSARFDQVRGPLHPSLLAWSSLEEHPGGLLALGRPPPRRGLAEALEQDPLATVRFVGQAAMAMAALHRRGLCHGGLIGSTLGVTATGRLALAPPALHELGSEAKDRRELGRLVQEWMFDTAVEFNPLLDMAIALQQGHITSDADLLVEVLQMWEMVRAGAGRYALRHMLDEGGMGEVWRAYDHLVGRDVALKMLKDDARMSLDMFVAEARLTGRLQHPNIVPVYDLGTRLDGRSYYTMEEVRGPRLDKAIRQVHAASSPSGWGTAASGLSLRRLVEIYARVAETLAFVHDQDMVHCDVKPANVVLGEYGEVRVMDWGLGVRAGTPRLAGTPGYWAPEQAAGEPVDPRSDVHAFGITLLDLLYGVGKREQLETAPPAPDELVRLAERCTETEPADRPADGGAVAAALRAWLDGLFKRDRARAAMEAVADKARLAEAMRSSAAAKRLGARRLLDGVRPSQPVVDKLPGWALEDAAKADELAGAVADTEYEQGIRAALELDPGFRPALDALADVYKARLQRAEAAKDEAESTRIETLLRGHDGGRHVAWLRGDGALTLVTSPPGATVIVERYEVAPDRRLVPVEVGRLGPTPIFEARLPRGSYRLRLTHPACEDVVYPVFLDRGEHWDGVPPEGGGPHSVPLLPKGSLGEDECYVPAGWFWSGGDSLATDSLPRRRVWIDGFRMKRTPVTHRQYLDFLSAVSTHNPRLIPAVEHDGLVTKVYEAGADGRLRLGEMARSSGWGLDFPVVLVDQGAAMRFAGWYSGATGQRWELPHDLMWEKAARGVDGRAYPWGDYLDPALALMNRSHAQAPSMGSVNEYPDDRSPYGILGMGGNTRDLCANAYHYPGGVGPDGRIDFRKAEAVGGGAFDPTRDPHPGLVFVRGGSWQSSAAWCRSALRLAARADERSTVAGFRLLARLDGVVM